MGRPVETRVIVILVVNANKTGLNGGLLRLLMEGLLAGLRLRDRTSQGSSPLLNGPSVRVAYSFVRPDCRRRVPTLTRRDHLGLGPATSSATPTLTHTVSSRRAVTRIRIEIQVVEPNSDLVRLLAMRRSDTIVSEKSKVVLLLLRNVARRSRVDRSAATDLELLMLVIVRRHEGSHHRRGAESRWKSVRRGGGVRESVLYLLRIVREGGRGRGKRVGGGRRVFDEERRRVVGFVRVIISLRQMGSMRRSEGIRGRRSVMSGQLVLLLVIVLVLLTGERSERCSSNVGAGRRRHRGPIHAVEGRRVRWVNVHAKYVD